jgi:hypothetical protein
MRRHPTFDESDGRTLCAQCAKRPAGPCLMYIVSTKSLVRLCGRCERDIREQGLDERNCPTCS